MNPGWSAVPRLDTRTSDQSRLANCALEQIQATMHTEVIQNSGTCQGWDDRTCTLRQRQKFRVFGVLLGSR